MPSKPGAARGRAKPLPGEEHLVRREGSADWHIDITVQGRRLRRSSGTSDKALAAAAAAQAYDALYREVVLGERPAQHMTLNEAFVAFYEEVAKGTAYGEAAQKHQMHAMLEILGKHTRLADIDDAVVNGLVQALRRREIAPWNAKDGATTTERRTLSGATINRYVTTLSAVCNRARKVWKVDVGDWAREETRQEESKGREVFLEIEEARALVDGVVPHARPILMLALSTGLRKANVHNLRWEEVSADLGRVVLMTKGGKPHSVPLPEPIVDMLVRLAPDPTTRRGPVFWFGNPAVGCECAACKSPARRGQPINSTKRAFATAARTAGLASMPTGRLRFHDLRHTLASWLLAQSGDLQLVREQLGHADITTTARYSHLVKGRREAVVGAATAGLLGPAITEEKKKA